jgi:hypothetical protein
MHVETFNHSGYGFSTEHMVFKGKSLICRIVSGAGQVRYTLKGHDANVQYERDQRGIANAQPA